MLKVSKLFKSFNIFVFCYEIFFYSKFNKISKRKISKYILEQVLLKLKVKIPEHTNTTVLNDKTFFKFFPKREKKIQLKT